MYTLDSGGEEEEKWKKMNRKGKMKENAEKNS